MPQKIQKKDAPAKNAGQKYNASLRALPGVDRVLELLAGAIPQIPKGVVVRAARLAIKNTRNDIARGRILAMEKAELEAKILSDAERLAILDMRKNLHGVINGTGVVVHTNLGRSLLSSDVCKNIADIASRYSNLEFDLGAGKRGSRYSAVDDLLCELTGAQAAMVVNNNAGAVFLCLHALARGRQVVVSRGELVEIGGSFRIPDVMAASGAVLREVGTTNRTHASDYETAIGKDTAMVLKVHTSNFAVMGFTAAVKLKDLVPIGQKHGLLVMEDLGSGSLVDLSAYGLAKEPTVGQSVATGADVVTFSGDKMLGGPQAGIIVGKKQTIEKIKNNPVTRALRIDKLTLAALESTLRLYRDPTACVRAIPTLRMLTENPKIIQGRAKQLMDELRKISGSGLVAENINIVSRVGGGALPLQELPSHGVGICIDGLSANAVESAMRGQDPPVIGRIENDVFVLDMRTISDDEIILVTSAVKAVMEG